MAEPKMKNEPVEQQQQRGVTRRQEYPPSRELFSLSPFSMMRRLSEEMDRAFASTFGLTRGMEGLWSPPVDVREREGNLEIEAELPGLTKDDVKVECTEDSIIIEGEKRREHESREGGVHRTERSYGHFYRAIPLPEGTDTSKITADFKDGVLQVKAPLSEQHRKARQIPINS